MSPRLSAVYQQFGRIEKFFLLASLVYVLLRFTVPTSGWTAIAVLVVYVSGIVVAIRWLRKSIIKLIWRLRNRLIVAYLFIALVPILLIVALAGIASYGLTGQLAVYLVNSELDRRTSALRGPAQALARTAPEHRPALIRRLQTFLHGQFPELALIIRDKDLVKYPPEAVLEPPPAGWRDANGIIVKQRRLYSWAHAMESGTEVTILAPLTHEFLAGLVQGLGDVFFLDFSDRPEGGSPAPAQGHPVDRVPPASMRGDVRVTGFSPVPVSFWESPEKTDNGIMVVHTRPSAVLRTLFGKGLNWGETYWTIFLAIAGLFLLVELVSLIIGISITRTITGAVHELYLGTQRVKEADFSHRIPVRGKDQLAELGSSFNIMTENLARLIVVAKEKERLESELEIAREVQKQLFPKESPYLRTLGLTGVCNPARVVSGDYYDFMSLRDSTLAFAIGDVAGKGISAALLMAAIQSTMRAQLTAGIAVAATAGNGGAGDQFSAAQLVSLLNKQLYANTAPEKYATFYFGVYEDQQTTLTYTNAGHLPPILVRNGIPESLDVTGTVVGAFPFARYEEKQLKLLSGDLLVAYTDGITEPENEYGEMFGEERLKELLVRHWREDSREIIARVMEAVQQWTGSSELQDDMTMLLARRV